MKATWKYGLIKYEDGFKVAEIYQDGFYALLDTNDWYFETKDEFINVIKTMLKDIEDEILIIPSAFLLFDASAIFFLAASTAGPNTLA